MTRREMYEYLKNKKVAELKEIAKENHIHVLQPNKKRLIEKIIEGTIGAKLRSEAIKSINLGGRS